MPILLSIFILLIAVMILPQHTERTQRHRQASNGIINHNADMREFYYRAEKNRDEILQFLRSPTQNSSCKYRFEESTSSIVFSPQLPDGSLDITYNIFITERQGYSILKVVQQDHLWEKNPYALLQNEFWHQLLEAEPIPYVQQPSSR